MPKILEADSKDAYNHVRAMASSVGYQIVMAQWADKRECIIKEACINRSSEKVVKNLARLQGFQEAIDIVKKILDNPPFEQDLGNED